MATHFLHRLIGYSPDDRLAEALEQLTQGFANGVALGILQQVAGHQQGNGGGVDQPRGRLAHVGAPGAGGDLVFDQFVDCGVVRHAQQRLGQTHQGNAFLGGKAVLCQELFHDGGLGILANAAHQFGRTGGNSIALGLGQLGTGNHLVDNLVLVSEIIITNRLPAIDKLGRL